MRKTKKKIIRKLIKGKSYISVESALDTLIQLRKINKEQHSIFSSMVRGDDEMYDLCHLQVGHIFRNMWYKNAFPRNIVKQNLAMNSRPYSHPSKYIFLRNIAKYKRNARRKSRKA